MDNFFKHIKPILALIVVTMTYTIFLIALFMFRDDINVVSQVIIAVVGGFGVATGYYFGYSQGAAKKDETLQNMAQQPTVSQAETVNVNSNNNKTDPEDPTLTVNN